MKNTDTSEVVQWSYDFIQSFYLNNNETQTETEVIYQNYLSPFGNKYFSSLNPFLIYGGADISKLMKKNVWLLRDGLIPLSFFFQNASLTLMEDERKFLVHKDFWFLVPPEWQESVLFYEKVSDVNYGNENPPQKLILAGIANQTLASQDEFLAKIENLAKVFTKKDFDNMEISAYFPNKRNDLWGRWQDENIFQYSKIMFQKIKLDIDFPEWDMIKSNMDFKNSLYYEINSGSIIRDTFTQEMFLSRGAGLLKNDSPLEAEGFTKIRTQKVSLYHSVNIYEFDYSKHSAYSNPLDSDLMPYFKKILEKSSDVKILSQGWELWYGTFVKKHYDGSKLI